MATFKPENLTILQLMTGAYYNVREYQRAYSWEDEQVERLWDDIYSSFESYREKQASNKENGIEQSKDDDGIAYFLGSLIVVKNGKLEDIVDGQQRITTLTILLAMARRLFPDINSENDNDPTVANQFNINNCISSNNFNRLRFSSKAVDLNFFKTFLEKNNYDDLQKPSKKELSDAKKRYENTAYIFKFKLLENKDIAPEFLTFLINNVQLIKITCSDISFAISLFQVLNDRGLDLSPTDIIKSYLMEPIAQDELTYNAFIKDWEATMLAVKDTDATETDLLTFFFYYLNGGAPKKNIVDDMRSLLEKNTIGIKLKKAPENGITEIETPTKFIINFKDFTEHYKNIYQSDNKVLNSIWYLPWDYYWATILSEAKHLKYQEFDELAKGLRNFLYINYIAGISMNSFKQTLQNIIENVKKKESYKKISQLFWDKVDKEKVKKQFVQNINSSSVYGEKWLKPLLITIEYSLTETDNADYIANDKTLHAEHILPQNYKNVDGWKYFSEADGQALLNSLGNMTLLTYQKNIHAKDAPFVDKMMVYGGQNGDNKITKYRISQNIYDDFVNKKIKVWDKTAINNRKKWLLEKTKEILELDFEILL